MGGKYRGSKGKRSAVSAQDGIKAHLSMADEARNTERHFLRRSGLRLRDNGIKFVSAGDMKPDDPAMLNEFNGLDIHENTAEDTEPHEAEGAAAVHGVHQDAPTTSAEIVDSVERVSTNGKGENQLTENRSPEPLFFYDVEGDPVLLRVERPNPVVRCDTPVLTDSSDDEVIFKGRGALKPAIVIEDPMSECPNSPRVKEAEMPRCESPDNQNTYAPVSGVLDFEKAEGTFSPVSSKAFISLEATTRISKRASKRRRFPREQEDDDGVLADYIENIMNQPSSSEDGAVSDVPGNQSSTVIHTTSAGLDAPVVPDQDPFLSGIFIDRTLLSGTGLAPSPNEPGDIEMDELDEPDLKENSSVGDELDREIDPQPRKYKPGTGVTVFAENLDFSDILDADDDGMDYSTVTRKSRHRNRGSTRRTNFPSASAFADALDEDPYGAFDIMDFDRPSLRKKPKGKRNIPEFGLSDSEMEWQLQMTWENDRKKKKIKKQQREELRAQGLLGKAKKSGTNSGGMKAEDIVSHVRTFLLSDNERLLLPPMDKTYRKFVHEMANTLSLGSISKGQGAARFPILTKTTRTPDYDSDSIDRFDRLISRNRFLRRIEKTQGHRKNTEGESTPSRARGGTKAASYIDGDVVGASAPEIGIENKGRVMLEKMGWTTGTALGAVHNKGILQPVAHVVKTSRAGLG